MRDDDKVEEIRCKIDDWITIKLFALLKGSGYFCLGGKQII